jgi:ATP-dependent Lhr-like helicase
MVHPSRLEHDLVLAALASPFFGNRWRWNATRALALLRHEGGRRVPMPLQRMRSDDLLAGRVPRAGGVRRQHDRGRSPVPDHPLVRETIDNCLHEAMDLNGLVAVLGAIERGDIRTRAIDTPAPSPMSHEILNSNPYSYLDDAPLEERRARAVVLRRTDPDLAGGLGALDPAAIAEVRRLAWPDVRDADELHDVLLSLGLVPARELEAAGWEGLARELLSAGSRDVGAGGRGTLARRGRARAPGAPRAARRPLRAGGARRHAGVRARRERGGRARVGRRRLAREPRAR